LASPNPYRAKAIYACMESAVRNGMDPACLVGMEEFCASLEGRDVHLDCHAIFSYKDWPCVREQRWVCGIHVKQYIATPGPVHNDKCRWFQMRHDSSENERFPFCGKYGGWLEHGDIHCLNCPGFEKREAPVK
jgi:hypothetical protein